MKTITLIDGYLPFMWLKKLCFTSRVKSKMVAVFCELQLALEKYTVQLNFHFGEECLLN